MESNNSAASIIILIITVGLSLYTIFKNQKILYNWSLVPIEVINEKKYYQLLSSGFLHVDMQHLLFNMITFFFFAFALEQIVNTFSFLIIYFGSMLAGNIFTVIKKKNDPTYRSIGASGAISGVVFSYILINPTSQMMIMPIPIPIPAWLFGIVYLAWTIYSSKNNFDRTNHFAHLFGAIAGIIITLILFPQVITMFLSHF